MKTGTSYENIYKYKPDWDETRERFKAWWNRSSIKRPMLSISAKREIPLAPEIDIPPSDDPKTNRLEPSRNINAYRNYLNSYVLMGESFPNTNINLGAGSMALYLGSEPEFSQQTIWFKEIIHDWKECGALKFDPDNFWWQKHLELIAEQRKLSNGEFLINIPDIVENLDILSALRGPQNLCIDLMDEPELIKNYVRQIDELYFKYYDRMYDLVKDECGANSYTAFNIWGPGKTAKVQCDFSAMISPDQFREFVQPSLRQQCRQFDNTLYHLDGPDAVKHLDAVLEIEELDALQWTPGAGKPDAGSECWYSIHDKVKAAGKSLWISIGGGDVKECVEKAEKLVNRYGPDGLYLLLRSNFTESEGRELLEKAERAWNTKTR